MEERARPRTLRRVATETRRDRQVCDASRQKQGAIARFATRRDRNKGAIARFATRRDRNKARPPGLRRVTTETRRGRQVCDASRRKQGAIARFATRRDRNKARSPGLRRVATETKARSPGLRRVATETRRDRQVCDASQQKQGGAARFATRRDGNKARSPGLRRVATETRR